MVFSVIYSEAALADLDGLTAGELRPVLELPTKWFIVSLVSKLQQIEAELEKLTRAELWQVRNWLDDVLEDELEFTPAFEAAIQQSEGEMSEEHSSRIREP